ncbi:MAG: bifunctional UDP-N-acetylglucosamine diphosphorylase/glucosamine-1-phosphate N-acetyltransferase GlmU [Rickettsiales bacterium]|jgi:bifunctional UDP-N-acetylglucosamine pyrophosphorylase/glucosamine-1-phosphate N-acetyltransferase|nr:bifunctional UDP-N-acetylglucosamine diphosphorylase/glucosamine-1-phosphate N-acetyltransferase GlmU [Rickettsiales bacterium]
MGNKTSIIILGAGKGARMKSDMSKLLHKVGNLELISHVLNTSRKLDCQEIVAVLSENNIREVEKILGDDPVKTVIQVEKLGTGRAVAVGLSKIENKENNILVAYGDTPFISLESYKKMLDRLDETNDVAVILGFRIKNIENKYGRLLVNEKNELIEIREYKDASEEERRINLCNGGIMAIRGDFLSKYLNKIDNKNAAGEYYLTDLVKIAKENGFGCSHIMVDENEIVGVNSREELARAEKIFQDRRRKEFMEKGVTLIDPDSAYFSYDTEIESDVVIEPNTVFLPGVKIKKNATVKAFSYLEGCALGEGVSVGPFARLRPGAALGEGAKIGNFVEIKNSAVGKGVKIGHLTYIGDAEIGENTNIGCGSITCNYDGYKKFKTKIGRDNFIGSNTVFVAPVETGDNCLTAAGSVITKNVERDALAVGRGEQKNIEGGMIRYRKKRTKT